MWWPSTHKRRAPSPMLLRLLRSSSSHPLSGGFAGSRTRSPFQRLRCAYLSSKHNVQQGNNDWPHEVFSSDSLTHRKSVFQAHATKLSLPPVQADCDPRSSHRVEDRLEELFAHIQKLHPRTKRATHRMWAYRCRDPTQRNASAPHPPLDGKHKKGSSSREGAAAVKFTMASFSDVEPASGAILERLLELNHHEDVVVVVYRWYGGVKIGGERWRCISNVASEALRLLGAKGGEGSRQ